MKNIIDKKQISYRLGVDLGTSSIGVAVYSLDHQGNINKLEHLDSYIFGEPVVPKEMVTLNTARRSARLIRRQVERKAARLRKIGFIASHLGVGREELKADTQDVIMLRALAVEQEITLPQLVKVFSHIVKNRGYKGVLKKADGAIKKQINETISKLDGGNKTLGQLLYERRQAADGQPWRKVEETGTFIYRQMVEEEFDRIYETQRKFHPELNGLYPVWGENMFPDFPGVKEITLKDAFHSAMFYQRPIKWELDNVGNCELYPDEKRAACAQPAYQQYRLAKEIANLRLCEDGSRESYPLTLAQRTQLFEYVNSSSKDYRNEDGILPFTDIYKFLGFPANVSFSIDRKNGAKQGIKGNLTLWAFEKAGVLNEWENLPDLEQELVIEFLANITTFSDIQDNTDAYVKESVTRLTKNVKAGAEERAAACRFILLLKQKGVFEDFQLESGRASYSVKGLRELTERIRQGEEEADIVAQMGCVRQQPLGRLRTVAAIKRQEAINDPVIGRALTEFHRVMTYITHRFGNPAEIVVELSRDIKNSLRRRQFLERQNKLRAEERKKAIAELQSHGVLASRRNIEKYLLWEEQAHLSPYSGKTISFAQAFDEKQTQVDHIVPRQGDVAGSNMFENKVLAFTDENKAKSNNLPYEKFKDDIEAYKAFNAEKKAKKKKGEDVQIQFGNESPLINFVKHLWGLYAKEQRGYYSEREHKYKPTQKGKRIRDKIDNLLMTPAQLKDDFKARQNQETAWIGKIVTGWCKDICPKVTPSYGTLTAYVRSQLHFDRILPLIRIAEGKDLFNKDDKKIDVQKWREIFDPQYRNLEYDKTEVWKEDFEKYLDTLADKLNTSSDKQEAFRTFCREQREQVEFNKRCDHRHHAVDAAVIGLCSLSLVQKASRHNQRFGTLYKIEWTDKNGIRDKNKDIAGFDLQDIRLTAKQVVDEATRRLTNYVVWHKPDHFPSGRLFDETAYNITEKEGKERFVKRAPLSGFVKKTAKETRENLEKLLFGDTVKRAILEQFQERVDKGMSTEEALCGKKDDPMDGIYYRGNKVKQVKYMYLVGRGVREFNPEADKKITHKDKNGREHRKGYQNYGYACMDFDTKTGKQVALIPLWKYQQQKQIPEGVTRVFIGDILFNKTNKTFYVVKQFKARDGLGCSAVTEAKVTLSFSSSIKNLMLVKSRQGISPN